MKLTQYWDAASIPPEIEIWINALRDQNPEYEHQLYRRDEAASYIGLHLGDRERAAFLKCAVPAGQADYFRLCVMVAEGGLYLDADSQPLKPLATLFDDIPHALLCTYAHTLNTSVMMFRAAGHSFMIDCLELATDNIEHRRFKTVFTSTGPSVLNAVHAVIDAQERPAILHAHDNDTSRENGFPELLAVADRLITPSPAKLADFRKITTFHAFRTLTWIGPEQPAYKATDRHWLNWTAPIYL